MRKLIAVGVIGALVLTIPPACLLSVAVAASSLLTTSQAAECAVGLDPSSTSDAATADEVVSAHCTTQRPGTGDVTDLVMVPAPDSQAATAVSAALAAVGRGGRYVAEGNGPTDFDCSGLTAWAWRQAGVSLVDYSYTQRAQTRDIPRALAQPGDLVFWFGGAEHHVAIVVAVDGGQITIAEAANPDAGLRVRQLGGGWDDAYLTGFGRVVRG